MVPRPDLSCDAGRAETRVSDCGKVWLTISVDCGVPLQVVYQGERDVLESGLTFLQTQEREGGAGVRVDSSANPGKGGLCWSGRNFNDFCQYWPG